jgi:type VII secretion-associated serine protease mycosin
MWVSAVRLSGAVAVLAIVAIVAPQPTAASASPPSACYSVATYPLPGPVWALTRLRPDLAWPLSRGAGVTVAVIDSGVFPNHAALAGKVLPGRDLVVEANKLAPHAAVPGQCDEYGHGTVVAGIIAGRETQSSGYRFSGIAPDASILPIRVLRDQSSSDTTLSVRIADAVTWAVDAGHAGVVNLSLVTNPTPQLAAAVQHALAAGVVVVAAAGNDGSVRGQVEYPAAYDGVIGVAGSDRADAHVASSTSGNYVDVSAPGVDIVGPAPASDGYLYVPAGGTSFAAAYVSGVVALIRAHEPGLTPAQVADMVTRTADHPPQGWTPELGYGVVNPARAVGALAEATTEAGPPAGRLEVKAAAPAPRDAVSVAAPWVAACAVGVALAILVAVPVTRRGRARRWRPGRR